MTRLNSFYLQATKWDTSPKGYFVLDGQEAKHLLQVLRTPLLETVRIFDGLGRSALCILEEKDKKTAYLKEISQTKKERTPCPLRLAVAWTKNTSRKEWFLEKAVEFGVSEIVFWQASYSQSSLPFKGQDAWLEKCREKCIQAAKQCGAVYLPEIIIAENGLAELLTSDISLLSINTVGLDSDAVNLDTDTALLTDNAELSTSNTPILPSNTVNACFLWESNDCHEILPLTHFQNAQSLVFIGPEGGFSPDEVRFFQEKNCKSYSLGKNILRWETAAIHCAGLWMYAQEL